MIFEEVNQTAYVYSIIQYLCKIHFRSRDFFVLKMRSYHIEISKTEREEDTKLKGILDIDEWANPIGLR